MLHIKMTDAGPVDDPLALSGEASGKGQSEFLH